MLRKLPIINMPSPVNPYAVTDPQNPRSVASQLKHIQPLVMTGRLSRLRFLLVTVGLLLANIIPAWLLVLTNDYNAKESLLYWLVLIPSLAYLATTCGLWLCSAVRRCHDFGSPGLSLFVLCIPLGGVFFLLALFYSQSQNGENAYGYPNSPISPLEKWLLAIMICGIAFCIMIYRII